MEGPPVPILKDGIGGRIVGGQDADEGEYPWQVSWRTRSGDGAYHSCGGSILSADWVLSAGHCCAGINAGEIAAGINDRYDNENKAQTSTFTKFLHPDYSASNTNNDVCLLKLDMPLNLTSDRVSPIKLNRFDEWEDVKFTVTGWGTTSVI